MRVVAKEFTPIVKMGVYILWLKILFNGHFLEKMSLNLIGMVSIKRGISKILD